MWTCSRLAGGCVAIPVGGPRSGSKRVGGLLMRVAYHRSVFILVFVLALSFSANAQTWRQVGPPGGDVQSLATVPGSARTLFLGTSDGHVFGSRDGGEHWGLLGRICEHHDDVIMSMVVDARSAKILYATSWTLSSHGGGVYRSA